VGLVFFQAPSRADLGQVLARVGFCSVPEDAVSIFDNLVADLLPTQGYGNQAFMGKFEMESQVSKH
jgi:hypothetical protein